MYLLRNKTQIGNKPVPSVTIKPHEMGSLWYVACVASVSVRFRSKEWGTSLESKTARFISRTVKTENPVPWSFFAPKLNGNACYAGYVICQGYIPDKQSLLWLILIFPFDGYVLLLKDKDKISVVSGRNQEPEFQTFLERNMQLEGISLKFSLGAINRLIKKKTPYPQEGGRGGALKVGLDSGVPPRSSNHKSVLDKTDCSCRYSVQ